MSAVGDPRDVEIARLTKRLARERKARQEAESIGESSLRQLYERSREIALIQSIAASSNAATSVESVLQATLDEVCRYTGWPVGHAWLPADDGTGELVSTRLWHLDRTDAFEVFRRASESIRFAPGIGLPGRVLEGGRPAWITDVHRDPNFPRARVADDIGVRAGFGFPILVDRDVVGVLEFFSPVAVEPDEALLETMGLIGIQLGRVVERSRTERMRQDFVAMLVHDIKTPLAAVLGFAELLREDVGEGSEARDMLDRIEANAQHATALTLNLLDAQRIQSGRLELRRGRVSVNEIVLHALRHQGSRLRLSEISTALDLDGSLPDVDADERLIDRVVANLLSNAIKFSPSRGTIGVATAHDGERVRLSIRDQGPGVPPESRAALFRRFGLPQGSRPESSGLGLFIVKTIVTAHGGDVGLTCPDAGGSEFTVTLPIG